MDRTYTCSYRTANKSPSGASRRVASAATSYDEGGIARGIERQRRRRRRRQRRRRSERETRALIDAWRQYRIETRHVRVVVSSLASRCAACVSSAASSRALSFDREIACIVVGAARQLSRVLDTGRIISTEREH